MAASRHAVTLRDGATLSVTQSGADEQSPLVLISGLGGTASFWQPFIQAFGPSTHTISFDQRGIGASTRGSATPLSIATLAEDTWELIDSLCCNAPTLMGHSTGGAIVQEMALMRPGRARGLILSATWAGPDDYMARRFALRLSLLDDDPAKYAEFSALSGSPPRWLRDHPEALAHAIAAAPGGAGIAIVKERIMALLAHDRRAELGDIATPMLILGAEDDVTVPPYLQDEIAAALPSAAQHTFPTGGHFYPVTRPAETAQVVQTWLSSVE